MREAWLFGFSLFHPSQQSNIPTSVPRRAKKDSKFPLPGEQDRSSALPQGQERPVKSPPHDLPPPPLLGDPRADKGGEGKSKRVEKCICICATFFRPFRLSLVPNICPWVSEDGNPDALTWGERIHVMQLARNKLFCCLTKHFKSS